MLVNIERQRKMESLRSHEPLISSVQDEPYFSWSACEACGEKLGGFRYDIVGKHDTYSVCPDCLYFMEYGILPDGRLEE